MERDDLARLILAELAKPRWEGKFGPSSWDLRATLRQEGATIAAPDLAALLATLRQDGLLRYQSPPGVTRLLPGPSVRDNIIAVRGAAAYP